MKTILLTYVIVFLTSTALAKRQPHILFILADDYGYNDIGYHGSEIKTPELDKLAADGVKLENYYVQPICSPTRSQLMTGRYQIHTGIQHSIFWPLQPNGLPLGDPTLADKLRETGYSTHAVGKWHLGFFRDEYLPTNRGFDTFFGILNGKADHFKYNDSAMECNGLDLYDGKMKVNDIYRGQYSTELYTKKTIDIVRKHDNTKPLFMYLSFQAVHSPLQVPDKYLQQYKHIKDENRRLYAGMTSAMDEAVGNVIEAFKSKGLWEDTLLVFSTDNGGQVLEGGNNWPLRGWKGSLWEGGIHGIGFVHGQMIKKKGRISRELIHVSDWFPTLINLADGSLDGTNRLDGLDQWNTISLGEKSKRKTILHNIDHLMPMVGGHISGRRFDTRYRAALRHGDWKIITGNPGNGSWLAVPTTVSAEGRSKIYKRPENKNVWLFNITNDPYERADLSETRPEVVETLLTMLAEYSMTSVPCFYPDNDLMADPKLHGGYWGPWIATANNKWTYASSPTTWRYSLMPVGVVALYCIYYRCVKTRRSCKTTAVKYKM